MQDVRRQVICEEEFGKSFKSGLQGDGLKEHSLSQKMFILRRL